MSPIALSLAMLSQLSDYRILKNQVKISDPQNLEYHGYTPTSQKNLRTGCPTMDAPYWKEGFI
jgi:hypothetical protein